jgi:hypothetical protein
MPWKSKAQARWGHSEAGKKALGGEAGVKEWDSATHGKKLPEKINKSELTKALPPKPPGIGSTLGMSMKNGIQGNVPSLSGPGSPGAALKSTLGSSTGGAPKDISKVGKVGVRTPKPKAGGDAFGAPSQFFGKSEGFDGPKHPSVRKLWVFMNKHRKK